MRKSYFTAALVWTIVVTYLSLSDVGGLGTFIKIPHKDKIAHFVFYFLFYMLWFLYQKTLELSIKKEFKLLLIAIGYGALMEILQAIMGHHRTSDWVDVVANSVGAFTSFFLCHRFLLNKKHI